MVGVVQPSEKPSRAVPDNVPDKLEFHWLDVPMLVGEGRHWQQQQQQQQHQQQKQKQQQKKKKQQQQQLFFSSWTSLPPSLSYSPPASHHSLGQARSCGLPPDTPLIQELSDLPETEQAMKRQSPLEQKRNAPAMGYTTPNFPLVSGEEERILSEEE